MSAVPGHEVLSPALRAVVAPGPGTARVTAVLGRQANAASSTFESEIVTCRLSDGREVKLLCKHERFQQSNPADHQAATADRTNPAAGGAWKTRDGPAPS